MMNRESQNYILICEKLKELFENIEVTDQKLRFYQGTYPVVSFIQTNNYVRKESLGFDDDETMNIEEYEIEIESDQDMNEIRSIMNAINDVMHHLGYIRTYCGLDTQDKETKLKRMMLYQTAS